jgi:C4-dicarboxylate transporter, DctQ subunit
MVPGRAGRRLSALTRIEAADRAVERVERIILVTSVLAMALLAIAGVAARNLLAQGLVFGEEVQQLLLVWITFVGIAHGAREGRHIRMSALCDRLPQRARRFALAVTWAVTSALLLLLAVWAISYTGAVRAVGSVTPALRIPLHAVYAAVPAGLFLGALQYALAAARNLLTEEPHLSWRRPDSFRAPGGAL